jgi:voltage-gated potassium channel
MLKFLSDISHHTLTRLLLGIVILALTGALLVFQLESGINQEFSFFGDAIWWILVTMTTVGYGDIVPVTTGGRLIGVMIMFFGVALMSLFTATISSIFVTKKIKEGRGLEEIKIKNHLIICGWNFNAERMLSIFEQKKMHIGRVVLVNQLSEEAVSEILQRFSSLKIKFVRGDYSRETVLRRANVQMAHTVVLLPDTSSGLTTHSDEKTILSTLTIKSINQHTKVLAFIIDRENLSHLKKAKADEVLVSDAYAGYLMASHILSPGIPQVIHQLFSEDGAFSFARQSIPGTLSGKTYNEVIEKLCPKEKMIVVGLGREDEGMDISHLLGDDYSYLDRFIRRKFEEAGRGLTEQNRIHIRFNPPSETIVDEKDFLIVISRGENPKNDTNPGRQLS